MMTELSNPLIDVEVLRSHICDEIILTPGAELADDQELLLSGLLDSLGVMRLAGYLEAECSISVPPEDVILENFSSLRKINTYLQSRA